MTRGYVHFDRHANDRFRPMPRAGRTIAIALGVAAIVSVAAAGAACSGKAATSRASDDARGAGSAAGAASGPAAASARHDLLAEVPEDTMFVLAMRDDLPAAGWQRLARDLAPVIDRLAGVARDELAASGIGGVDADRRRELSLLAELAGSGLLRPRGVIYELRGVTVVRVEATRAAELAAAVGRAVDTPPVPGAAAVTFDVRNSDNAIHVAVRDGYLVLARGEPAAMTAVRGVLDGTSPLPAPPLAVDALDELAAAHALLPSLVGYVDFARIGDRLKAAPAALGVDLPPTPGCADAVAALLARIPRLVVGVRTMTAEKVELAAEIAIEAAELATLRAAQRPVAGLPIAGSPIIGVALAGSGKDGQAAWREALFPLIGQCVPEAGLALLASPVSDVRAFAAAIYDGTMQGFFPTAIDGYVAMAADDLDGVVRSAGRAGLGNVRVPADGKPFAKLSVSRSMRAVLAAASIARRGDTVVMATGPAGRTQAETTFGATAPAPFLQFVLDLGRIDRWQPASATNEPPSDADRVRKGSTLLADAGWEEARRALITTVALTIETNERGIVGRFELGLAPPGDVEPPPPPPSREVRECRRILDRAWTAAAPALARLGVTTELDEIERTYRSGLDTLDFGKTCVALPPAERACILAAADPLTGAARCVPASSPGASGSLELPRLFSFFGPQPLEERWSDLRRVPVPDEATFLVPTRYPTGDEGWLVRDAAGCTAVSAEGLVLPATCTFVDRDGARWLDVTFAAPCPPAPAGTCPVTTSMRKTGKTLDVRP
jgi:hypothetical protein